MASPRAAASRLLEHDRAIAVALVIAGAALRLHGLDAWALNPDEGDYARIALSGSWRELGAGLAAHPHPPAFHLVLRLLGGLLDLFGASGDGTTALRWPSLVFGSATIWGTFAVARPALGRGAALGAAALVAFAPGAVLLSQLVRPYAMQWALLLAALAALQRFVSSGRRRALALYAGSMGAALLTHYGSLFVLAGVSAWLGFGLATRRLDRHRGLSLLWVHGAAFALMAGLYAIHLHPYLEALREAPERTAWLAPFMPESPLEVWLGVVGIARYLVREPYDGLLALLVAIGWLSALAPPRRALAVTAGSVLALAAAAGLLGLHPFGGTRHATASMLFFPLLAAEGVRWLGSRPDRWRMLGAATLALGVLVPSLPRALVGAERLDVIAQVEQVAPREALAAWGERLRPLSEREAVVLSDAQAFAFLFPILRDARRVPGPAGAPLDHYRWGRATLLVARVWSLPDARAVAELARHAHPARVAWLVQGGWGPLAIPELLGLDRSQPAAGRLVLDAWTRAEGGVLQLDLSRLAASARR